MTQLESVNDAQSILVSRTVMIELLTLTDASDVALE